MKTTFSSPRNLRKIVTLAVVSLSLFAGTAHAEGFLSALGSKIQVRVNGKVVNALGQRSKPEAINYEGDRGQFVNPEASHGGGDIEVGFTPGSAVGLVLAVLNAARSGSPLDMAAYEFTHKEIAEAVVAAHRRGAKVRVVVDQERISGQYNAANYLANQGVPVVASSQRYKIFHHKFIVLNHRTVQTGSFNYTSAAAQHNAENVILLKDNRDVATKYTSEFERLWREGTPLRARY